MRIGFIGLGAMGAPMAMNLIKNGHEVTAYDTRPVALDTISAAGGTWADNCTTLAARSELVITMLPRPIDVQNVLLGEDGAVNGLDAGDVFMDMSTGDPDTAKQIANTLEAEGVYTLDCPVGRTQVHAEAGTLLLLAGGSEDVIDRLRPVLLCMGDDVVKCGGNGMGQVAKLVNNLLAAIVTQGIAEAVALGIRAGLPLETIESVTNRTMAGTRQFEVGMPAKALSGDLDPGFSLELVEKDVGLASELANRMGVAVPAAQAVLERCAELIASGRGQFDIGMLVAALAEEAGIEGCSSNTAVGDRQ